MGIEATATPRKSLLTLTNHTLILVDYQFRSMGHGASVPTRRAVYLPLDDSR